MQVGGVTSYRVLNIAMVTGCPADSNFSLMIARSSTVTTRCSHSLEERGGRREGGGKEGGRGEGREREGRYV